MSILKVHLAFDLPVIFQLLYTEGFPADANTRYALLTNGFCEPEVARFARHVLRPGDFVIDAGANIGFFTVLFGLLVGPTGQVVAVEPGPNNWQKLKDNITHNKLTNVKVIQQPLWSEETDVILHICADSGLNSLKPDPQAVGTTMQRATTLAKIAAGEVPRLVKIDVEGAEEFVCRGFGWEPQFVIAEMNLVALARFDSTPVTLRETMYKLGYDMFLLPKAGGLPAKVPEGTKISSNLRNLNVLFSTERAVAEAFPELVVTDV